MSLAELTIPMDSLRKLPPGAAYEKKSGQATVKAAMKGSSVFVSATCDSLQNLVYQYEEELTRIRDQLEQYQQESEPCESPFKWYLYGILTGVAGAIIILLFIKYRRKWQNIF